MKRCLFLLLAGLTICSHLRAEVLLVEDFTYNIGELLTDNGWYTQYGDASGIGVTNGLSLPPYASSAQGNAALIDCKSGSSQAHRAFKEVTEGNVYAAFMLLPSINYKKGWFFSLRDDKARADNYSEFNFNGRVLLEADNRIGLAFADNQQAQFADTPLDNNTTYIVVLKYTICEGNNNDAVSLWVLEKPVREEPATPLIGPLQDAGKKDIAPANVVLRGYDADGWLVVDGIRIATTWQEAVALTDEETASATVAAGQLQGTTYVYNCLGACLGVYTDAMFHALPRGMYMLKTGSVSRKVLR